MKHIPTMLLAILLLSMLLSGCDNQETRGEARITVNYEIDRKFQWSPEENRFSGTILVRDNATTRGVPLSSNSYGIMMFALMMYIFDGLKDCTPDMLVSIIVPMIILIVIGVAGMCVASFIIAKIFKMSFPLAFANGLTALYGFPPDAIITESTCTALAENEEEKAYLMSKMFPSMIVGGFTTVTITSVIIAGFFAKMF